LNSESRLVTYVNKKGERSTLPLNHALESNNAEMTKRLKYTKDILTHMLNNNTNGKGGQVSGTTQAFTNGGMSSSGGTGVVTSSRMGTITSAVSSKRSAIGGDIGSMPQTVTGRTGSS
jgi:hypothetical protein